MEIKPTESPQIITNFEVFHILSRRVESSKKLFHAHEDNIDNNHRIPTIKPKIHKKLQHLHFIEEVVYQYLQTTLQSAPSDALPSLTQTIPSLISTLRKKQDKIDIDRMDEIKGFGLSIVEVLQILNLMPITELVELHLIIQNLDQRMDAVEQRRLMDFLQKHQQSLILKKYT